MERFLMPFEGPGIAAGIALVLIIVFVLWAISGPRINMRRSPANGVLYMFLVPFGGLGVVTAGALVLIGLVVLRAVPGMGMIFSPHTHANLWNEVKPGYNRTPPTFVGDNPQFHIDRVRAEVLAQAKTPVEEGYMLFTGVGCALCHGIGAQGSAVGPSLLGASPQTVKVMVRFGPGGMPSYNPEQLPEKRLDSVIAYLQSLGPGEEIPDAGRTPTPSPTPTQEQATAPTPTPTPIGGAPTPVDEELVAQGQGLFSAVGCAACHGARGQGGFGPSLVGVNGEQVKAMVRDGSPRMPSFTASELPEDDLRAIIAFILSLP